MEHTLYKIIFPEHQCLYIGITSIGDRRYNKNNQLGGQFYGPHRNPDVSRLLDEGAVAFWIPIKKACKREVLEQWETNYLTKVWKTEEFSERPKWLLNRSRISTGNQPNVKLGPCEKLKGENHYTKQENWNSDKHWTKQPENKTKVLEHLERMKNPAALAKRKETRRQTQNDPNYVSPLIGRHRPDHSEFMKQKIQCPYCELKTNAGALSNHIKHKHKNNVPV